jgi:hypothetical protein
MWRLLALAAIPLKIWMFVDALRRRVDPYWLWIIAAVPFGEIAYFFRFKARDRDVQMLGRRLLEGFERPPGLEELRDRAAASPSLANQIALAQGLADAGRYAEARDLFERVLAARENEREGLYGLGICRLELGDAEGAVAPLEKLVALAPAHRDWAAWPDLAEALERAERRSEALELLRELCKQAPRLRHEVLLARHLERAGERREAVELLERALREAARVPRYTRKLERASEREARRILDRLGSRA